MVQRTQTDQLDLFRIQTQLSTGRRIFTPSEDAPSALRAITLQRNLERKEQLQVNRLSAEQSLTQAEIALEGQGGVNDTIISLRALTVFTGQTSISEEERQDRRTAVFTGIDTLVNLANATYQDTYLFGGTRSLDPPYSYNGRYVEYLGNESNERRLVDVGQLFDTNVPGDDVFGGLSEPVRGTADLGRHLTQETLLSDLHSGEGIDSLGSLEIAYIPAGSATEAESTVIDLSSARTVGDVVRLIESNGPPSAELRVDVTGNGLTIEVEPSAPAIPGPGAIVIRELAGGRTAQGLGITSDTPVSQVVGEDLDPQIGLTTQLNQLLGTKSQARIELGGSNNDLVLTATANGSEFNGVQIEFIDGAITGSEVATFAAGAPPTLQVTINDGSTTAAQVAAAINAEGTFNAALDHRDALSADAAGSGTVLAGVVGTSDSSGSGGSLDLASGLLLTNGDGPFVVDTSGVETVEDLLNELNQPEHGLRAELNSSGTGINIRSRRSGADFTIAENGGTLAAQLGVRSYTGDSRLEDFNRGKGVISPDATDFTLVHDDGLGNLTEFTISLGQVIDDVLVEDIATVDELIDEINAVAGPLVTASLETTGNGIQLAIDNSSGETLTVSGKAAGQLGFFAADEINGQAVSDGTGELGTEDRHTLEVDSLFNTLLRLADALDRGEQGVPDIAIAQERLDQDFERVTFAEGEIGSRLQSLETLQFRLEDEEVQVREALSLEIDVDFTQAISDFTARQFALQASLQTTANLLQLSILSFI